MPTYDNSGGFTKWDISFFFHFWVNGFEFGLDTPGRIRRQRSSRGGLLQMSAGNHVQQVAFLGGNAPINLAGGRVEMGFPTVFAKEEYFRLMEAMNRSAHSPVELFLGTWQTDEWYLPTSDQDDPTISAWLLSRTSAYDLVDIDAIDNEHEPVVWIDDVAQTRVTSATPGAGEFYIDPAAQGDRIITPTGITGTWLRCRYMAKLFLSGIEGEEETSESNLWGLSMEGEEALPARNFSFPLVAGV